MAILQELSIEIEELERQKNELEDKLKKVLVFIMICWCHPLLALY